MADGGGNVAKRFALESVLDVLCKHFSPTADIDNARIQLTDKRYTIYVIDVGRIDNEECFKSKRPERSYNEQYSGWDEIVIPNGFITAFMYDDIVWVAEVRYKREVSNDPIFRVSALCNAMIGPIKSPMLEGHRKIVGEWCVEPRVAFQTGLITDFDTSTAVADYAKYLGYSYDAVQQHIRNEFKKKDNRGPLRERIARWLDDTIPPRMTIDINRSNPRSDVLHNSEDQLAIYARVVDEFMKRVISKPVFGIITAKRIPKGIQKPTRKAWSREQKAQLPSPPVEEHVVPKLNSSSDPAAAVYDYTTPSEEHVVPPPPPPRHAYTPTTAAVRQTTPPLGVTSAVRTNPLMDENQKVFRAYLDEKLKQRQFLRTIAVDRGMRDPNAISYEQTMKSIENLISSRQDVIQGVHINTKHLIQDPIHTSTQNQTLRNLILRYYGDTEAREPEQFRLTVYTTNHYVYPLFAGTVDREGCFLAHPPYDSFPPEDEVKHSGCNQIVIPNGWTVAMMYHGKVYEAQIKYNDKDPHPRYHMAELDVNGTTTRATDWCLTPYECAQQMLGDAEYLHARELFAVHYEIPQMYVREVMASRFVANSGGYRIPDALKPRVHEWLSSARKAAADWQGQFKKMKGPS